MWACVCITKKLAQPNDTCHKAVEWHLRLSRCEALRQSLNHLVITLHPWEKAMDRSVNPVATCIAVCVCVCVCLCECMCVCIPINSSAVLSSKGLMVPPESSSNWINLDWKRTNEIAASVTLPSLLSLSTQTHTHTHAHTHTHRLWAAPVDCTDLTARLLLAHGWEWRAPSSNSRVKEHLKRKRKETERSYEDRQWVKSKNISMYSWVNLRAGYNEKRSLFNSRESAAWFILKNILRIKGYILSKDDLPACLQWQMVIFEDNCD